MGGGSDSNAGRTTVKIDLESRDRLRYAAICGRTTMAEVLAKLIGDHLPDVPAPPSGRRRGATSRKRRAISA